MCFRDDFFLMLWRPIYDEESDKREYSFGLDPALPFHNRIDSCVDSLIPVARYRAKMRCAGVLASNLVLLPSTEQRATNSSLLTTERESEASQKSVINWHGQLDRFVKSMRFGHTALGPQTKQNFLDAKLAKDSSSSDGGPSSDPC